MNFAYYIDYTPKNESTSNAYAFKFCVNVIQ